MNGWIAFTPSICAGVFGLAQHFTGVVPGHYVIIILDALYRFMPDDAEENSSDAWKTMYNLIDRYALQLRTAFINVHHASKGSQAEKAVVDVGAGGNAQSRASDTHMVLRPHREDDAVVLDAVARSWKPIEPFCLRWNFPLWTEASELDPEELRQTGRKKKRENTTDRVEEWTLERFVSSFLTAEPVDKKAIRVAAVGAGLSGRQADDFLVRAEAEGRAHRWKGRGKVVLLANVPAPSFDRAHVYARTPHTPQARACARVGVGPDARAHSKEAEDPLRS